MSWYILYGRDILRCLYFCLWKMVSINEFAAWPANDGDWPAKPRQPDVPTVKWPVNYRQK
ncbi:hypothetical protein BpHYR1_029552 [Brachionus plicatilis]|uniref:Uncharacterized protein n=1 Tax=Brachionus plicatilis TaxID=10195 RepID=A0A3M7P2C9_BRAPC|nr:hypothetical protein BpHYR1_029552 [Brachionus plicatilis]